MLLVKFGRAVRLAGTDGCKQTGFSLEIWHWWSERAQPVMQPVGRALQICSSSNELALRGQRKVDRSELQCGAVLCSVGLLHLRRPVAQLSRVVGTRIAGLLRFCCAGWGVFMQHQLQFLTVFIAPAARVTA